MNMVCGLEGIAVGLVIGCGVLVGVGAASVEVGASVFVGGANAALVGCRSAGVLQETRNNNDKERTIFQRKCMD